MARTLPAQEASPPPDHLARLRTLLDAPQREDLNWRKMVFQSVRRLEFGPVELVRAAWEALDLPGDDRSHANLLVYLRRHGLPLPPPRLDEGADSLLERALAAWGQGELATARQLLSEGHQRYPDDMRFSNNLPWLNSPLEAPAELPATAGARELALAVLARRQALP